MAIQLSAFFLWGFEMFKSKRYRIALLIIEILDVLIDKDYDGDTILHCKNCCENCNRGKYKPELDIDSVDVKW